MGAAQSHAIDQHHAHEEAERRLREQREALEREQQQRAEEDRRRYEAEQNRLKKKAEKNRREMEEKMRQLQRQHQEEQERIQREAREREQLEKEQRERAEKERRRFEEEQKQIRAKAENDRRALEEKMSQLRIQHEEEQQRLKREADAKLAAETALLKEVQSKLLSGIQPEVWPTAEERAHAAKILMQPAKDYFHCAVAGTAGAGKSSLINAFRGLRNNDPSPLTAKTGETETTLEIGRFPHPSDHEFLHRFVWYDIPGAGTVKVKGWQYFNNQGLFVFDLIVVVVGDRFTEQDVIILEHCQRFKIPAFIVRSKANQYINNRMENTLGWLGSEDERSFEEVYQEARREYEEGTRRNFRSTLREAGLDPDTKIYIVNNVGVYHLLTSNERKLKGVNRMIDEVKLAEDLVRAIEARRYKDQ